jgi:glucosyl-3-phosphoglycerate synthase
MAKLTDRHREDARNHRDSADPARAYRAPHSDPPMSETSTERWARERTYHHSRYSAELIARERAVSVSVCLPAKECAGTVGAIVGELAKLREKGAIDEVVVVDAASADGTAEVAERAGATVWQEAELMPRFGPVEGKGDAMWRALSVLAGDAVCYLDADTEGFQGHFATGLLGPLVCEEGVEFVKAFYRRPFEHGGVAVPDGGGRVNHLTARPALALFYPDLAGVRQPLAGEVAARRELLERLPFATGYGVEIAMLIDVWREVGLEGMAQVDLEVHRNRHQPLQELAPMALTVLATVAQRLEQEGRLVPAGADAVNAGARSAGGPVRDPRDPWPPLDRGVRPAVVERPPLATVGVA